MEIKLRSYAKKQGKQIILGNDRLKIVWTKFLGEYQATRGGGIWFRKNSVWVKLADMDEGEPALIKWSKVKALGLEQRLDPRKITTTQPTQAVVKKNSLAESEIELSGGKLTCSGVIWIIKEYWGIKSGDNKLYWSFRFTPSIEPQEKCLLNIRFNLLPHRFRTITLSSYCGFYQGITYAIYPTKDDPWWMRLDGAKLVHTTHYPFTYKPTKIPLGRDTVIIKGYFLADEITPKQLLFHLHNYLSPQPDGLRRPPESVMKAAYTCINRSFKAAISSGHFKEDEGALLGLIDEDGFKHLHMRARKTAYDVGFSLGWCGQVLSPLMAYHQYTKDKEAKEIAVRIANWVIRKAQTPCGFFHEIYDIKLNEGCDFIGEDLVYSHTSARNAAEILYMYSVTQDERYLRAGLKTCDWFLNIQELSGAIQWKFVDSTGEPEWPSAYAASTAEVLVPWARAYQITGERKYLEAAIRLAHWAIGTFVDKKHYGGLITDDLGSGSPTNGFNRWETPSPAAICFLIDGFINLYKVTSEGKYLRVAKEAGYFLGLHQWLWEFPRECLTHHVKGTTQGTSGMPYCIDQILGAELPLEIEAFLSLYEITKREFWLKIIKMALARLVEYQFTEKGSPFYGAIWEGWSLTKDIPLPKVQGDMNGTNRIPGIIIRYIKALEKAEGRAKV